MLNNSFVTWDSDMNWLFLTNKFKGPPAGTLYSWQMQINISVDRVEDESVVYRTDVNPLVDITKLALADTPSQLDSVPLDLIVLSYRWKTQETNRHKPEAQQLRNPQTTSSKHHVSSEERHAAHEINKLYWMQSSAIYQITWKSPIASLETPRTWTEDLSQGGRHI